MTRKKWSEYRLKKMYLQDQLMDLKSQIKEMEYNISDKLLINNCEREYFLQRKKYSRLLKREILKKTKICE